jgi:hypothetical protein
MRTEKVQKHAAELLARWSRYSLAPGGSPAPSSLARVAWRALTTAAGRGDRTGRRRAGRGYQDAPERRIAECR